jgi:hypothetical protein
MTPRLGTSSVLLVIVSLSVEASLRSNTEDTLQTHDEQIVEPHEDASVDSKDEQVPEAAGRDGKLPDLSAHEDRSTTSILRTFADFFSSYLMLLSWPMMQMLPLANNAHDSSKVVADLSNDTEKDISDLLGWTRFPELFIRVDPKESFLRSIEASEYEPLNYIVMPSIAEQLIELSKEPEQQPEEDTWSSSIETHLENAGLAVPNYATLLEDLDRIISGKQNEHIKATVDQITVDVERHGYPAEAFDIKITKESLIKDCFEVCSVYALVFDPKFGYLQGMADYCVGLKMIGGLTNEESFNGLVAIIRVIAQINVPGFDLIERSFLNGQVFIHLFTEMNKLTMGDNIFNFMEVSAIREDGMLPGHILANQFDLFTISAGFRANPRRIRNPAELAPIVDLVVRKGRAGFISIFLAGLEINMPIMHDLVRTGRWPEAVRFIADPFAPKSTVTVDELVHVANTYLVRTVGNVPFPTAISMIDALVLGFVPLQTSS